MVIFNSYVSHYQRVVLYIVSHVPDVQREKKQASPDHHRVVGLKRQLGPEKTEDVPSGYVKIAIENGPVEIVDFPMKSMVDLSIVFCERLPEGTKIKDLGCLYQLLLSVTVVCKQFTNLHSQACPIQFNPPRILLAARICYMGIHGLDVYGTGAHLILWPRLGQVQQPSRRKASGTFNGLRVNKADLVDEKSSRRLPF